MQCPCYRLKVNYVCRTDHSLLLQYLSSIYDFHSKLLSSPMVRWSIADLKQQMVLLSSPAFVNDQHAHTHMQYNTSKHTNTHSNHIANDPLRHCVCRVRTYTHHHMQSVPFTHAKRKAYNYSSREKRSCSANAKLQRMREDTVKRGKYTQKALSIWRQPKKKISSSRQAGKQQRRRFSAERVKHFIFVQPMSLREAKCQTLAHKTNSSTICLFLKF